MELKTNIPELIEKLENVKAAVGGSSGGIPIIPDFSDALYSALNAGMGKMKFRIFNKGLDADGRSLGGYVGKKTRITKGKLSSKLEDELDEKDRKKRKRILNKLVKEREASNDSAFATYSEYEKKRLGAGRQILYKDLQFDGSLFSSVDQAGRVGDYKQVSIVIVNEQTALIAGYQEEQIGKIRGEGEDAPIFQFSEDEFNFVQAEADVNIGQVVEKLWGLKMNE